MLETAILRSGTASPFKMTVTLHVHTHMASSVRWLDSLQTTLICPFFPGHDHSLRLFCKEAQLHYISFTRWSACFPRACSSLIYFAGRDSSILLINHLCRRARKGCLSGACSSQLQDMFLSSDASFVQEGPQGLPPWSMLFTNLLQ